jgi:predicted nucleotidyltransferase
MAKATLSQVEIKRIVRDFVNELESRKIRVDKIILFGSYAQGTPRTFSDIDLAVISPSFGRKGILKIQEDLARAAGKYLSLIEAIGFSTQDFERAENASFLGEVKRKGKVVYSAHQ